MKTVMKLNAIVIVAMMMLLFSHAILAGGTALGLWSNMGLSLAKMAYYLIFVHLLLATIRTMQMLVPELKTMAAMKECFQKNGGIFKGFVVMLQKAELGKKLKKQNRQFWMTRVSGLVFLTLVFVHKAWMWIGPSQQGILKYLLLLLQLLFIMAIFIHIIINIRPLLGKFGLGNQKVLQRGLTILCYLIMLFICGGMSYYFIA